MFSVKTLAVLAAALALPGMPRAQEPLTVFAAASLTDAMSEAGEAFEEASGNPVRFSFASSSTLARQIEAGAPADVYASASAVWMDYLEERGLIVAESRVSPFGNELALVAPLIGAGPVAIEPGLDLAALLGEGGRLAVGDPAHVPAGIYAEQALRNLGAWQGVADRIAAADNVRAALALVERGEAPLGVVYATDARVSEGVAVVGTFPPGSHDPIVYPVAVVEGTANPEAASAFIDFLAGDLAASIFARHGFVLN